jgi:hypothetical protein
MEDKKNELNLELIHILYIMDIIDGKKEQYPNYVSGSLSDEDYMDMQIKLAQKIKNRLEDIFKE